MQCLIKGCNFMLHNIPNEIFEFHRDERTQYVFKNSLESDLFPYLLVNIGSGVSILKVGDIFLCDNSTKPGKVRHIRKTKKAKKCSGVWKLVYGEM